MEAVARGVVEQAIDDELKEYGIGKRGKGFSKFKDAMTTSIKKKIKALSLYRGVMRPYPHPRSNEVLEGLAAYRGGQSGMVYAEAFESVFRRNF